MQAAYREFLVSKAAAAPCRGFESIPALSSHLFDFQQASVAHLLHVGSGGLFLDTGLGKTLCQLEWSEHARAASNGRALILTPLAVARQIEREGKRFGYSQTITVTTGSWSGKTLNSMTGELSVYCATELIRNLRRALRKIRDDETARLNQAVQNAEGDL